MQHKLMISQNGVIFSKLSMPKNVKFLSGSRGPHGPDLPSPWLCENLIESLSELLIMFSRKLKVSCFPSGNL